MSCSLSIIKQLTQSTSSNCKQLILSSTLPQKLNKICNLDRFINLRILNLSNNCINKIQNISHLKSLKILNLQFNQIKILNNIECLINLQELYLSYNQIQIISQKLQENLKLTVLHLGYNQLKSIQDISPVFKLSILKVLTIYGNPFLNTLNYIVFIKTLLPQLQFLDQKNLNSQSIIQCQLNPQQEIIILRDTLNKLLDQRNQLATELQSLSSVNITSPGKINLKDYLKIHKQSRVNQLQHDSISPSNIQEELLTENNRNSFHKMVKIKQKIHQISQFKENQYQNDQKLIKSQEKIKMLQILNYWMTKLQIKIQNKKQQVTDLHQYYTNKIRQKQNNSNRSKKLMRESFQSQNQAQSIKILKHQQIHTSKKILNEIKHKQTELNEYKKNVKSIKSLIKQIKELNEQQEMYKIIMMRVLFGQDNLQKSINGKATQKRKRQLNYKELKHFLLSDYGLLNALNQLNILVFGTQDFNIQKLQELKQFTKGRAMFQIIQETKNLKSQLKKQTKLFAKQKDQYLKKLQNQTHQIYIQWQRLNQQKKQHSFMIGKQQRYQKKLFQQKQKQLTQKYQQIQLKQQQKLKQLQFEKQYFQELISQLQQKHQDLQQKYQRKYKQLQQFQKLFNQFKQQKQQLTQIHQQVNQVKRQLFQKQNLLSEINQKLKQLSLNQQINTERVKFLERKCYEKSEEIKILDQEIAKKSQRNRKLIEDEKIKYSQLVNLKDKISGMQEQQKMIIKNIQRHKSNLKVFEDKLKNLTQLQCHKKKSLQQLQLKMQTQKYQVSQLHQKTSQLQQILYHKQQTINSYQLKISQHKKSLQSFNQINKSINDLIQRQTQLKKNILELEIENGNLLDFKNQLIRQSKSNYDSKKIGLYY